MTGIKEVTTKEIATIVDIENVMKYKDAEPFQKIVFAEKALSDLPRNSKFATILYGQFILPAYNKLAANPNADVSKDVADINTVFEKFNAAGISAKAGLLDGKFDSPAKYLALKEAHSDPKKPCPDGCAPVDLKTVSDLEKNAIGAAKQLPQK